MLTTIALNKVFGHFYRETKLLEGRVGSFLFSFFGAIFLKKARLRYLSGFPDIRVEIFPPAPDGFLKISRKIRDVPQR